MQLNQEHFEREFVHQFHDISVVADSYHCLILLAWTLDIPRSVIVVGSAG